MQIGTNGKEVEGKEGMGVTSVNYFNFLKYSKKRAKDIFRLFVIYSNKPTPGAVTLVNKR